MERLRTKVTYALISGAVIALIGLPIGVADAASESQPTSAKVTKQVKKLKRQVSRLQQQLDEVAKQPGPQGPEGPQGPVGPAGPATGPAGGDLTGTFPNPLIGPAAVGSNELTDDSVSAAKIASDAVVRAKIRDSAVGSPQIADATIQSSDIGNGAVGAVQLKNLTTATSLGSIAIAGTPAFAEVTCPGNRMLVNGGYAWQDAEPNSILYSTPSETEPTRTWKVKGLVPSGSNTLFAWATCLAL